MLQRRIGMIWTSSGCAVWTSPRANSRADRALRLATVAMLAMPMRDLLMKIIASRFGRGRTEPPDVLADFDRVVEDRLDRNDAEDLVPSDRGEAGRGEAAAVAAIRDAAELAGRDLRLQVRGKRRRDAREDAVVRRRRRLAVRLRGSLRSSAASGSETAAPSDRRRRVRDRSGAAARPTPRPLAACTGSSRCIGRRAATARTARNSSR